MLVESLLVSLMLSAPPKPGVSAVATQKKLAAECVHRDVYFPPASIMTFESAKAAYSRFSVSDEKGEWHAPGAVRMASDVLFIVGSERTLALTSVDDIEPDDEQDDNRDPVFRGMDVGERFITLRFHRPGAKAEPRPTDRELSPDEKPTHDFEAEINALGHWFLVLVDRWSGKVIGAADFMPISGPEEQLGRILVSGDEVKFVDDLDEGDTVSLSWLERCALLEEDAAARAKGHVELARAAFRRAKGASRNAALVEAYQHFNRALAITARDSSLRIERAATLVRLSDSDGGAILSLDSASHDLDIAAKYPEDLSPSNLAEIKRLRTEISRLMREASKAP